MEGGGGGRWEALPFLVFFPCSRGKLSLVCSGIDFVAFLDAAGLLRVWAVDLNLRLTHSALTFGFFDFLVGGEFDATTGEYYTPPKAGCGREQRCYVMNELLYHPQLPAMHHSAFFNMCRLKGVSFDLVHRTGTVRAIRPLRRSGARVVARLAVRPSRVSSAGVQSHGLVCERCARHPHHRPLFAGRAAQVRRHTRFHPEAGWARDHKVNERSQRDFVHRRDPRDQAARRQAGAQFDPRARHLRLCLFEICVRVTRLVGALRRWRKTKNI